MLVRSTLFSRMNYLSQETSSVTSELNEVNKQIATGKRLTRMSQEAWSVPEIHQLRERIDVQQHYQRSSDLSQALLAQSENAILNVMNVIDRAKMLSVQMNNETFNADDRSDVVTELEGLKEQVRQLANSEFNGRYVFAGAAFDTEAFDASYAYQGSTSDFSISVSDSSSVDVGFDGSDVFQGSADVFVAFDDFITGLNTNNTALISDSIGDFEEVYDQLTNYLSRVGGNSRIADDMSEVAASLELSLVERLSSVEDVDVAEALSRFSLLQTQYEINLQLTAKTRSISLFERM